MADVDESWQDMLLDKPEVLIAYVRSFVEHLGSATQRGLEEVFTTGCQVSSGPIRGKLLAVEAEELY